MSSITVCFPEQIVVCSIFVCRYNWMYPCDLFIPWRHFFLLDFLLLFSFFHFLCIYFLTLLFSFFVIVFCCILQLVLAFLIFLLVSPFLFQFVLYVFSIKKVVKWCNSFKFLDLFACRLQQAL